MLFIIIFTLFFLKLKCLNIKKSNISINLLNKKLFNNPKNNNICGNTNNNIKYGNHLIYDNSNDTLILSKIYDNSNKLKLLNNLLYSNITNNEKINLINKNNILDNDIKGINILNGGLFNEWN